MKHLDMKHCWLQGSVSRGEFEVERVASADIPADLMTKSFSPEVVQKHLRALGIRRVVRAMSDS